MLVWYGMDNIAFLGDCSCSKLLALVLQADLKGRELLYQWKTFVLFNCFLNALNVVEHILNFIMCNPALFHLRHWNFQYSPGLLLYEYF